MGVGGGSRHEVEGRKKGQGRGAVLLLLKSPRGCFGTVMMGYEWSVGGGVELLPPPLCTNPQFLLCSLFLTYTRTLMTDLCACFVEGGDNQAGPLRRVCSAS